MRAVRDLVRLLLLTGVLLVALGTPAAAAQTRQGDVVTVAANETIDDDLYAFAGTINILGTVRGDLIATGGTVVVDGTVEGDVIAGAGATTVRGQVGGSVRAGSGTVTIDGRVSQDVLVGSGTLNIGPAARIGRDVLAGTGTATIGGEITRNVTAGGGDLTLDGRIGGNTSLTATTLRLTDRAMLAGSLLYASEREANIAGGAVVRGPIERRVPERAAEADPTARAVAKALDWLRGFVAFLLLGLLLVFFAPRFARRSADTLVLSPWLSLGIGAAVLVLVPIVAVIVFVLGVLIGGWWVGLVVLALYFVAVMVSVPVASLAVGRWITGRLGGREWSLVVALVLGLLILLLIGAVPIVGGVVLFCATLFGLGALMVATRRRETAAVETRTMLPAADRGTA